MSKQRTIREVLEYVQNYCNFTGNRPALSVDDALAQIKEIRRAEVSYPSVIKRHNEKWLSGYMKCRQEVLRKIEERNDR